MVWEKQLAWRSAVLAHTKGQHAGNSFFQREEGKRTASAVEASFFLTEKVHHILTEPQALWILFKADWHGRVAYHLNVEITSFIILLCIYFTTLS